MKTTFSLFALMLCLWMVSFSCTPKKEGLAETTPIVEEEHQSSQVISDTISKAKFEEWVKRWSVKSQAYMDSSKIDYFTMPLIDLNEFLGENPSAARFYIGLDSTKNNAYIPHIILVGTSANGDPRLNAPFHIYDVTTVCPPVCGKQ